MIARPVLPGVPAAGHMTAGGFWHPGRPDGCAKCEPPRARTFTITRSDVEKCPRRSLAPSHYREDGSCRCSPDPTTEERTS